MARPSPDPAKGPIAVLGAASPSGAHLKTALAEHGVPGARVALFGLQRDVAVLSEYDGEARLVQAAGELEASDYAAIFVCEAGHDVDALSRAAASGTLVVDLTGSIPGAVLDGAPGRPEGARLIAAPHPVTLLLAGLLAPIHRAIGVKRASVFVLRPTSDFGEAGLDELREQTVHLLRFEPTPTDVFGRQVAFNVVPEYLFPTGEDASTARVIRETRSILGAPELPLTLSHALVPIFYGHAIAVHLDLLSGGRAEALAAWQGAGGIEIAADPETGATLDAPDGFGISVCRVDSAGASSLSVWALGSEPGVGAAVRALDTVAGAGIL